MRVMALDIGEVRIGIALSDPMGIIASPLETYRRVGFLKDIDYILALAKAHEADTIVAGLPLSMDGSENAQSGRVREFFEALRARFKGKTDYCDERFTTVSAERVLIAADVSRKNRKKSVDKMAASLILQTYLAKRK